MEGVVEKEREIWRERKIVKLKELGEEKGVL